MQENDICFNDEDDIILPNSILGEFVYISFVLVDIMSFSQGRGEKFVKLKRQISFFKRWMKNR